MMMGLWSTGTTRGRMIQAKFWSTTVTSTQHLVRNTMKNHFGLLSKKISEKMKKLRHVVLHGLCDNQMLSILGQNCTTLQFLDITGSVDVTDLGIQNLVFPLSIQKAGRVNLVNTRARTNPPAKQLHTVIAKETGVDMTGCIILLQFCPRQCCNNYDLRWGVPTILGFRILEDMEFLVVKIGFYQAEYIRG